jgi:hypothetical protein
LRKLEQAKAAGELFAHFVARQVHDPRDTSTTCFVKECEHSVPFDFTPTPDELAVMCSYRDHETIHAVEHHPSVDWGRQVAFNCVDLSPENFVRTLRVASKNANVGTGLSEALGDTTAIVASPTNDEDLVLTHWAIYACG